MSLILRVRRAHENSSNLISVFQFLITWVERHFLVFLLASRSFLEVFLLAEKPHWWKLSTFYPVWRPLNKKHLCDLQHSWFSHNVIKNWYRRVLSSYLELDYKHELGSICLNQIPFPLDLTLLPVIYHYSTSLISIPRFFRTVFPFIWYKTTLYISNKS